MKDDRERAQQVAARHAAAPQPEVPAPAVLRPENTLHQAGDATCPASIDTLKKSLAAFGSSENKVWGKKTDININIFNQMETFFKRKPI